MAQDLESNVRDSSFLSPKELIAYRSYLLKLYLTSLDQLHISSEEADFYHKTLGSLSLPKRLDLLEYLKNCLAFLNSLPLVGYFRQNYLSIDGHKNDACQEHAESSLFHSRALTLVKGKK